VRTTVFTHLAVPQEALAQLNPALTIGSWTVPVLAQLGLVLVIGAVLLTIAALEFSRSE